MKTIKRSIALTSALILYVVFSVLFSSHANAANYPISPDDDLISYLKLLRAGDTLLLRGGIYDDVINFGGYGYMTRSGTGWDNPITIKAVPGEKAIIKPSNTNGVLSIAATNANPLVEYIIIDGLTIDGSGVTDSIIYVGGEGGTPHSAKHIRLINNDIVNAPNGMFIFVGDKASDFQLINNKIHDSFPENSNGRGAGGTGCGQSSCWGYPMYWTASGGLIEGNEIYNFPSYGIHMYKNIISGPPFPSNNVIRNNIIHDFSTSYWPTAPPGALGPGDPRGCGILPTSGSNNAVYNNIIYNGSGGICTDTGGDGMIIYNNTIYNMTGDGINMANQNPTVVNNILYKITGNSIIRYVYTDGTFSHNLCEKAGFGCTIIGDPLFTNAAAFNFNLQSGSPAIGAGNPTYGPNLGAGGAVLQIQPSDGGTTKPPSTGSCTNLWNSTKAIPVGFGASYNLFSTAKEIILNVLCGTGNALITAGRGTASRYIYKTGYMWLNNKWAPFDYTGNNKSADGNWFIGNASYTYNSTNLTQKQSVLAYICEWTGTQWKCGCRSTACANNFWNLQQFNQ